MQKPPGWTGLSDSTFHIKWRSLVEAELIRVEEDKIWVLTMIIRKANVGISGAEVRQMQLEQLALVRKLGKMEKNFKMLTALMEKMTTAEETLEEGSPVHRTPPVVEKESGVPDRIRILTGLIGILTGLRHPYS